MLAAKMVKSVTRTKCAPNSKGVFRIFTVLVLSEAGLVLEFFFEHEHEHEHEHE